MEGEWSTTTPKPSARTWWLRSCLTPRQRSCSLSGSVCQLCTHLGCWTASKLENACQSGSTCCLRSAGAGEEALLRCWGPRTARPLRCLRRRPPLPGSARRLHGPWWRPPLAMDRRRGKASCSSTTRPLACTSSEHTVPRSAPWCGRDWWAPKQTRPTGRRVPLVQTPSWWPLPSLTRWTWRGMPTRGWRGGHGRRMLGATRTLHRVSLDSSSALPLSQPAPSCTWTWTASSRQSCCCDTRSTPTRQSSSRMQGRRGRSRSPSRQPSGSRAALAWAARSALRTTSPGALACGLACGCAPPCPSAPTWSSCPTTSAP